MGKNIQGPDNLSAAGLVHTGGDLFSNSIASAEYFNRFKIS